MTNWTFNGASDQLGGSHGHLQGTRFSLEHGLCSSPGHMQNREQTGSGFLDHFLDKTDLDSDSSDNDDQDDNNIGLRLWF